MAEHKLPTRTDAPAFGYDIDLDKRGFHLDFTWNDFDKVWSLSITNSAGKLLVAGIPLVVDFALLASYRSIIELPPGELVVVDLEGLGRNPGRYTLGDPIQVLYYDAASMSALSPSSG